jgi:HEAT repeat protein
MWNGAPEDQLRAALAASRAGRVRGEEGAAALHAVLEDGLEHPERKVRQFAAAGLAALEAPGAVEALAGMLRRRGEGAGGLVDIGTAESRAAVTGLLQEMETWGPEAAGRLKRYLAAGEPFVASQAARVLARLQPPGTESALVEGLQAAELDVALVCAEGLSDMGAVERLPRLLAMVSERGHGYLAALKLDPGGAYAGFRELWHSPDPAVRARALRAMSAARKASDLRLFMEATHSADPGIRASAVGALSQFPGRNETTKRIIAMLDDGDPQVRRVARWVCQHLRRPEFAAPLLAQGAGGKYSDAARGAISSIAGVAPEELQILRWQALGFNIGGSVSLGIGLLLFALGAGPPVSAWLRRRHARGA